MEKFIPYEKLSKKEKRRLDLAKRQTWGELNPVTRKPVNSEGLQQNEITGKEAGITADSLWFFLDISNLFPYNLIRIWNCHRVVSESACLHIVRSWKMCERGLIFYFLEGL